MKNSLEGSSPEVRAFIYQQLAELESLLPQGTAVSVVVEDPSVQSSRAQKVAAPSRKRVIMQLETAAGRFFVEGKNDDIYKAITKAKNDLKDQLTILQSFLADSNSSRSNHIENILSQKYLH